MIVETSCIFPLLCRNKKSMFRLYGLNSAKWGLEEKGMEKEIRMRFMFSR